MTHKIYKITLPNGKIYIGRTTQTLEARLDNHLLRGRNQIAKALRNFPKDQIKIELLSETDHWAQARGWEIATIKRLNSQDPAIGYNRTRGGFYDKYDARNRNFAAQSRT